MAGFLLTRICNPCVPTQGLQIRVSMYRHLRLFDSLIGISQWRNAYKKRYYLMITV